MSSPSTPERLPPSIHPSVRRVHTLPSRLADPSRTPPQISHAADAIETLFHVGFAKVIAFDAPASSSRPNSQSGAKTTDQTNQLTNDGSLPWISPTERTLAAGPLKIYRVSNTGVSFLNSGSFLKHILSKSQCWCVDEEATFVLRGRDDLFYRIELPGDTTEEKETVEQFKKTLDQLLRYEKTPCPFRKGYVDSAELPPTPVRQKSLYRHSPAKKWRLNKIWEPEDADLRAEFEARLRSRRTDSNESGIRPITPLQGFSSTKESPLRHMTVDRLDVDEINQLKDEVLVETGGDEEALQDDEDAPNTLHSTFERHDSVLVPVPGEDQASSIGSGDHQSESEPQEHSNGKDNDSLEDSGQSNEKPLIHPLKQHPVPNRLNALRSVTAPPYLTVTASPPSKSSSLKINTDDAETASISSSRDSFYSLEEDSTEPFSEKQGVDLASRVAVPLRTVFIPSHSRDSSGTSSMVPETPRATVYPQNTLPFPATSSDSSDSDQMPLDTGAITPPTKLRLRRPLKQDEIVTELPGPNTTELLSPIVPTITKPLGVELIRTTYTILMSPPSHLISIMLRIAGMIVNRMPSRVTRHIPGSWESSDVDDDSSDEVWNEISDNEDDFGYSVTNYKINAQNESTSTSTDEVEPSPTTDNWEID